MLVKDCLGSCLTMVAIERLTYLPNVTVGFAARSLISCVSRVRLQKREHFFEGHKEFRAHARPCDPYVPRCGGLTMLRRFARDTEIRNDSAVYKRNRLSRSRHPV